MYLLRRVTPQRMFQIASAQHAQSTELFVDKYSVIPPGYIAHVYLEFDGSLTIGAIPPPPSTGQLQPDAIFKCLSTLKFNIPGRFKQETAYSGQSWCEHLRCEGVLGNPIYNLTPFGESVPATDLEEGDVVQIKGRLPIYVPDFAPGFCETGLTRGDFTKERLTMLIKTGLDEAIGAGAGCALAGQWRLMAYLWRKSSLIIHPEKCWNYRNALAATDNDFFCATGLRRMMAAYGLDRAEGTDPFRPYLGTINPSDKDYLKVDGELWYPEEQEVVQTSLARSMYLEQILPYLTNNTADAKLGGLTDEATAFPYLEGKEGEFLSILHYVDPLQTIGETIRPKGNLSLKPVETRRVYTTDFTYQNESNIRAICQANDLDFRRGKIMTEEGRADKEFGKSSKTVLPIITYTV